MAIDQNGIASSSPGDLTESETTGLPGVRKWSAVYLLVVGSFVLWVVLLAAMQIIFS